MMERVAGRIRFQPDDESFGVVTLGTDRGVAE
jgi:hypothetical protein